MRRALRALPLLATVPLLGCGTPSADLFVVERTGDIPGARLTLRVGDGGELRCNGGDWRTYDELLEAREIERDLKPLAEKSFSLKPGPSSVLRYEVRSEDGTVRFADSSRGQPEVLQKLQSFTRFAATDVCGLRR